MRRNFNPSGVWKKKSGTAHLKHACIWGVCLRQGGTRVSFYSFFVPTIFSGRTLKEGEGKGDVKNRNTPSFLPSSPTSYSTSLTCLLSVQTPPVPSTVTRPGSYDTQQQVRTFGCASSIGCFSLRRGGSPLAGV